MKTQTVVSHIDVYDDYVSAMRKRFAVIKEPLFKTNAEGLWDAYLNAIPEDDRQYHNCSCCRHFITRFGGLVTINDEGEHSSAVWSPDDTPEYYRPSVEAMLKLVRKAKVNGVFITSEKELGQVVTGKWTHFALGVPDSMAYKRRRNLTAGQFSAEKKEDFNNVLRAVLEFDATVVQQAVTLLKIDALYRSEAVLGPAEWLLKLHEDIDRTKRKAMMVWRAVATAPAGFCHPRSSMIGTLLEDLVAGTPLDAAAAKFKAKMHPLLYQRPQAAPKAGAIEVAEKLVAELDLASALNRRFLRPDEVEYMWEPKVTSKTSGGVFGHLKVDAVKPMQNLKTVENITLSRFLSMVLPKATSMRALLKASGNLIVTLTTAEDPDAKPIMQWDSEDNRNPVGWYLWHGGSSPSQYGLSTSVEVVGVCKPVYEWRGNDGKFSHHGGEHILMLKNARESKSSGSALFPSCLRSDLHAIRSVVEAHSKKTDLQLTVGSTASGLSAVGATIEVEVGGMWVKYHIDRAF